MRLSKLASFTIVVLIGLMTIVGLSGLVFLVPRSHNNATNNNEKHTITSNLSSPAMSKINLVTSDGKNIVGDFYQPSGVIKGWILYLHMMPATKESYTNLAQRMQTVGYAGLAIDLRGHGESEGGPDGYKSFSDEEHQKSIEDVKAAIEFLKQQGATEDSIYLVGASIGANLAIQYGAENQNIKKVVALSPGTDYHGIKSADLVKNFSENQKLLIIGSMDDPNVPGDDLQIEEIASVYPYKGNLIVKVYEKGGHGTDILENQPEAEDIVVEFLVD